MEWWNEYSWLKGKTLQECKSGEKIKFLIDLFLPLFLGFLETKSRNKWTHQKNWSYLFFSIKVSIRKGITSIQEFQFILRICPFGENICNLSGNSILFLGTHEINIWKTQRKKFAVRLRYIFAKGKQFMELKLYSNNFFLKYFLRIRRMCF